MINDKETTIESSVSWFIENRTKFKKLCNKISSILIEVLDVEKIPYHVINSRVKEVESFRNKISDEKYDNPIEQITDFAGIRIISYVEDDVQRISKVIESLFEIDMERSVDKSKNLGTDKVGYKSVHFIAKLKDDRLKLVEYKNLENLYFEIQVRTILQHAWAEIEHDRNYKFSGKLPDEIARRFMLLAGSLEMADREFNNISKEIDNLSFEVKKGLKSGDLNFQINSTSLNQFLISKFNGIIKKGKVINMNSSNIAIDELQKFGINNLDEFNKLFSSSLVKDIESYYLQDEHSEIRVIGMVRLLMILNDYHKYFKKSYDKKWKTWSNKTKKPEIFIKNKIDWDTIEKEYGPTL